MNGTTDGDETDQDCGGKTCDPCADGDTCPTHSDCSSNSCVNKKCAAATCMDMRKNGKETDEDCGGGTCDACAEGRACAKNSDCASGACEDKKCVCAKKTCADDYAGQCGTDLADGCGSNTLDCSNACGAGQACFHSSCSPKTMDDCGVCGGDLDDGCGDAVKCGAARS